MNNKEKEEHIFNRCFDMYYIYVSYIIENIIGKALPKEDKEEIISDVFISVWNKRSTIEFPLDSNEIKGYIGAVARNKAKNAIRDKQKKDECELTDYIISTSTSIIENELLRTQLKADILICLKEFKSEEQKCFIGFYYYQKSIQILAEELGKNTNTIKSIISRCRKKLKEKLIEKGYDYHETRDIFD